MPNMSDEFDNYKPPWTCDRWGDYEHDWLDCCECLQGYDKYLEEHEPT